MARKEMKDLRAQVNRGMAPGSRTYIELYGWTGARPDLISAELTESEALTLAWQLIGAVRIEKGIR